MKEGFFGKEKKIKNRTVNSANAHQCFNDHAHFLLF